jgi:5'-nucleotidase (lipoprotein e(P4) family)
MEVVVTSRGSLRAAVFAALAAAACAHPIAPPPQPAAPAPPGVEPVAARKTHENLNAVLWMQTSVEYQAAAMQAYAAARAALDRGLADRRWTAAIEQTGDASALPPAIVLDLDETVLDNSAFQARHVAGGPGFSETAWAAWCEERKAGAIPGAVEFLTYARGRGVIPFFVTNRTQPLEQATRDVLARLGVPLETGEDTVLSRRERPEWESSDKASRRQAIAARYRILLLVGDDLGDFMGNRGTIGERRQRAAAYAGNWGTKWIMLPNPTYGSWEQAIAPGLDNEDAAILTAKFATLEMKR